MRAQYGREPTSRVTLRDPATGARSSVDNGLIDHEGTIHFNEVKANDAQLERGQPAVLRAAANGTAVPEGDNAAAMGLRPGVPLGEQGVTDVVVSRVPVQMGANGPAVSGPIVEEFIPAVPVVPFRTPTDIMPGEAMPEIPIEIPLP
jgi:hypothetical protein